MRTNKKAAIQSLQHALKMLGRVKYGTTSQESHIDGDGPVNEFYAIGSARESLRRALEQLGVRDDKQDDIHTGSGIDV